MKKISSFLSRKSVFIRPAVFLSTAALLSLVFLSSVAAQSTVKIYPKTIRLEKGKTRTITATAFDASGKFTPNQTYNYSIISGNASAVSIKKNVEGNTEGNNSRLSKNIGEITGLEAGEVSIVAVLSGVQSSPAIVTIVDSAAAPLAVIKGDNEISSDNVIYVRTGEALEVNAESSEGVNTARWFWGDGDQTNDLLSATHAYLKAGSYELKLRVTNTNGQSNETVVTVNVSNHPTPTRIFNVNNLTELLNAYNQCIGGEHIVIPAGTVLRGSIEFPARDFSDFVTIRSSAPMPDLAVRVSPDQPGLVTFQGTYNNEIPVKIKNKANRIRFSGVKFDPFPGTPDYIANYYLLEIGEAFGQKVAEDNPYKIILEHCVVNPPDNVQVVHAVLNDGYKVSILASWLGNIKTYGSQDSQAIFGLDGRGAHVYNNTFFEAASESVIYGGSDNRIDGMVPTNIEFRRCFFTKRTEWRTDNRNSVGDTINEKNLFETKNARRLYVEGSVFTNHWDALRSQYNAIVLKSSADVPNSGQGVPWAVSEEIVFENNRISHINGGISVVRDAPYGSVSFDTLKPQHIKFINVLFDDMTIGRWGEHRTWAFYTNGVDDFQMKHVSIIDSIDTDDELKETAMTLTSVNSRRFEVVNSIIPLNYYGIRNSCAEGIESLNIATSGWLDSQTGSSCNARSGAFGSSWKIEGNIFPLMRGSHNANAYPANNFYPKNYSGAGMESYRRCDISWQSDECETDINDFALRAESVYKNKAADNTDPGIDAELLNDRLRCTIGGDTRNCIGAETETTPTPSPSPFNSPTPNNSPSPTPTPATAARINVALAKNGAIATASTFLPTGMPDIAIDGVRNWATSGAWKDATPDEYADILQIDFSGTKTINEIDVYAVKDDFSSPVDPTESSTFSTYGITDFDVQYWYDSNWVTLPDKSVTNNNKVLTKLVFPAISTTKIRVVVYNAQAGYSRIVELEAWSENSGATPTPTPVSTPIPTPTATPIPVVRTNVALEKSGGSASASSQFSDGYSPNLTINGGRTWSSGGGWKDATAGEFPDYLQVNFSGNKTINEIDVYAVTDDFSNPVEPTENNTFSIYGITDFAVQYWNGADWITVPNGNVKNTNKVWTKLVFSEITTTKIRILINNGQTNYSRIVEVEAWGN